MYEHHYFAASSFPDTLRRWYSKEPIKPGDLDIAIMVPNHSCNTTSVVLFEWRLTKTKRLRSHTIKRVVHNAAFTELRKKALWRALEIAQEFSHGTPENRFELKQFVMAFAEDKAKLIASLGPNA